ncbi:hypothetical protein PanWU01x14_284600 [Parasponia andersonii]|uniref:Uncharacterized protein n=1 Tax=Parasponia andersonii TaxID=3476 RepID=A0A2P5AZT3_PARAD|nr:hypothetical protein PanWU01x14_284600 [Parasponia andersonii]
MCVGAAGGGVVLLADVSEPKNMIGLTFGQPGHVPHHAHQPRVSCKNVGEEEGSELQRLALMEGDNHSR